MAELTPGMKALMPYWPFIEAAVTNHIPTAELWGQIRSVAQRYGRVAPTGHAPTYPATAADLSRLRGMAGKIASSSTQLAKLAPNQAIGPEHKAEAPWSRPLAIQSLAPRHAIRVKVVKRSVITTTPATS